MVDEAEHESYREYISAILKIWPEYISLHDYLGLPLAKWYPIDEQSQTQLVIADCIDESVEIQVFRQGDRSIEPCMLKSALKNYRNGIQARIIMVTPCDQVHLAIIDAIGMTLDVDPAFFQFAIGHVRCREDSYDMINVPLTLQSFRNIIILDSFIFVQMFQPQQNTCSTVQIGTSISNPFYYYCPMTEDSVLIFATDKLWQRPSHGMLRHGRPSIHRPVTDLPVPARAYHERFDYRGVWVEWETYSLDQRVQIFRDMLLDRDSECSDSTNKQPLEYISPLLWLVAQSVSGSISGLGEKYRQWPSLRDKTVKVLIRDHEECIDRVESLRGMTKSLSIYRQTLKHSKKLVALQEYCEQVLDSGQHICKLVQERIQVETSLASVRESRKSIDEAASVKRLTQLAFIFIPLTYASSLFGMNIKEMTGDGPKLWIFVVISICVILTTFGFSLFARRILRPNDGPEWTYYSAIFYMGRKNGLLWYIIKSGALITILTAGRLGSAESFEGSLAKLRTVARNNDDDDP